jgi:hypothetical protein
LDYFNYDREFPKDSQGNSYNRWEGYNGCNPENELQCYCVWRQQNSNNATIWDRLLKDIAQPDAVKRNASEYERALALIKVGKPVVLVLERPWTIGTHAVLAYEIHDCPAENEFWIEIYDSNFTKPYQVGTRRIDLTPTTAKDGTLGLTFSYGSRSYDELYAESPDPLEPIDPEDAPWDEVYERCGLTRQAMEGMQASGYDPQEAYGGTLDEGASSGDCIYVAQSSAPLAVGVYWEGSTLNLSLYRPDGALYEEKQSTSPPLMIEVPSPEPGEWTFEVTAVDVPYGDYPYVAVVGTKYQAYLPLILKNYP